MKNKYKKTIFIITLIILSLLYASTASAELVQVWRNKSSQTNVSSVDNSGNWYMLGSLGIGTTSPNAKLVVIGGVNITGSLNISGSIYQNGNLVIDNSTLKNGTLIRDTNSSWVIAIGSLYNQQNFSANYAVSGFSLANNLTGANANFTTLNVSGQVLIPNGNVGIGTLTPSTELNVVGSANITGGANISGNVNIGGNLDVTGTTQLGSIDFSGASLTADSINVTLLNVSGEAIFTNGNVGIGTDSPGQKLDVAGTINASKLVSHGEIVGNNLSIAGTTANSSIDGSTLFIDHTNNRVGIGTTTPAYPFVVNDRTHVSGNIYALGWFENPGAVIDGIFLGADTSGRNAGVVGVTADDTGIDFYTQDSSSYQLSGYFEDDGDFFLNEQLYMSNNKAIKMDNSGGSAVDVLRLETNDRVRLNANEGLEFTDGGILRMFMDGSGNFGIGTTTPESSLVVVGGANITGGINTSGNINMVGEIAQLLLDDIRSAQFAGGVIRLRASGVGSATEGETFLRHHIEDAGATEGAFIIQQRNSSGDFISTILEYDYGDAQWSLNSNGSVTMTINDNVGIGTTTPGSTLHVAGSVNISPSGDNDFVIDSSGRVMIGNNYSSGVDTRADDLTIGDIDDSADHGITILSDPGEQGFIFFGDTATGSGGARRQGQIILDHTDNHMAFHTKGDTEAIRITEDGYLGIGTKNPQAVLHINDTSDTMPAILVNDTGGKSSFEITPGAQLRLQVDADANAPFRIRLDGDVKDKFIIKSDRFLWGNGDGKFHTNFTVGDYAGGITMESNGSIKVRTNIDITDTDASLFQPVYGTDDGLVLYLPFSESADDTLASNLTYDRSPYGYTGTCQGTAPGCNWTSGKYGYGMQFDGSNLVNLSDTTALEFQGEDDFSVMFWVKFNDANRRQDIMSKRHVSGNNGWLVELSSNDFAMAIGNAGSTKDNTLTSPGTIVSDTWYHYAVTRNANVSVTNGTKHYINGEIWPFTVLDEDTGAPLSYTNNDLIIGEYYGIGNANPFNGTLDEVMVFNRILAEEEVRTQYLKGSGYGATGAITADNFRIFDTDGNVDFIKDSNGNVGIGTSTPLETLTVIGNINSSRIIKGSDLNATISLTLAGSSIVSWDDVNVSGGPLASDYNQQNFTAGYALEGFDNENFSARYAIDGFSLANNLTGANANFTVLNVSGQALFTNGDVGIGTDSPSEVLTVIGNINSSGIIKGNDLNATTSITLAGSRITSWDDVNVSVASGPLASDYNRQNFTADYALEGYDSENFTEDYAVNGFDNENFTTRHELRTGLYQKANFTSDLSDSGVRASIVNNITDANTSLLGHLNTQDAAIREGITGNITELYNGTIIRDTNTSWLNDDNIDNDLTIRTGKELTVGGGFGAGGTTIDLLGNIKTEGDIWFSGNITVLDVNNLQVNGSFYPSLDNTFNIGNASLRWKSANFTDTIEAGTFTDGTAVITGGAISVAGIEVIGSDGEVNDAAIEGTITRDSELTLARTSIVNNITTLDNGTIIRDTNTSWVASSIVGANANFTVLNVSGQALFPNGNVGIGTLSPNYELEIANTSDDGKTLNVSSVLYVNGSSSNVGIGTSEPTKTLTVIGDINSSGVIKGNDLNATTSITLAGSSIVSWDDVNSSGDGGPIASDYNRQNFTDDYALEGYKAENFTDDYAVNGYHRENMTLDFANSIAGINSTNTSWITATMEGANANFTVLNVSGQALFANGNVGIGTLTPTSTLDVAGTANITSSSSSFVVDSDGSIVINLN